MKIYNKLIRNKIAKIIKSDGKTREVELAYIKIKKKSIVDKKRIIIISICMVAIIACIICLSLKVIDEIKIGSPLGKIISELRENKDNITLYVWSGQLTISILSATVISLIANNLNDKFMGMSVKGLLFGQSLFEINFIEILLVLFMITIFSLIFLLIGFSVGVVNLFIVTMMMICYMMYLTIILKIKKSRIYWKVNKKIIKSMNLPKDKNEKDELLNKKIIKPITQYCSKLGKKININKIYVYEEIVILINLQKYYEKNNKIIEDEKIKREQEVRANYVKDVLDKYKKELERLENFKEDNELWGDVVKYFNQ